MNRIQTIFIQALTAALQDKPCSIEGEITAAEWKELFSLAIEQKVLPLIYQSVYSMPQYQKTGQEMDGEAGERVLRHVMLQMQQTFEFLQLYKRLDERGLQPVVVKGIVCRRLYPQPDYRPSGDEDLLIPQGSYDEYKKALFEGGMELIQSGNEDTAYEVRYRSASGRLMVEVHRTLFSEEDGVLYEGLNDLFSHAFSDSILVEEQGVRIRTLNESQHLLYLLLHAYKHFLSGGFGIRQLCDMVMFANACGDRIDWDYVMAACERVQAGIFAASLFRIGREYLILDPEKACYPESWRSREVDPEDLLLDVLQAGIYGSAELSRKHSSSITIGAVEASRAKGKGSGRASGLLKAVFPSAEALSSRYPYLKEKKYLLPMAWLSRIFSYTKEIRNADEGDSIKDALRIGNERVGLMKKYGIIRKHS